MDTGGGGQVRAGVGAGDLLTSCWQLRCGLRQAGLRWGLRQGVALPRLDPAERGGNTCYDTEPSLDVMPGRVVRRLRPRAVARPAQPRPLLRPHLLQRGPPHRRGFP